MTAADQTIIDEDGTLPSRQRTAVVVLGMHRSGTSALTGVLAEMGCAMPEHLMAPEEINPKGFFESDAVTGLNDQLLASAGQTWDSFQPVPSEWFDSPAAVAFMDRAVKTIRDEYGDSDLFAMKDPRVCRLVPFWDAALRRAECTPVYVCTHRHPRDVASSMQYRGGFDVDYGLLLWLRHAVEAESDSRGKPRVFVSYDQLLSDWAATVATIGTTLNLSWPRSIETARDSVDDFLSSKLRNFAAGNDEDPTSQLPEWVRVVYSIMERWAAQGEDKADHARLDEIRRHLTALTPTLGGMIEGIQNSLADRRTERAEHDQRIASLTEQLGTLNAERERLINVQRQREQEIEDRSREAAHLAGRLAELQASAERLCQDHTTLVARHRRESRQLDQLTRRVAAQMRQDLDNRLSQTPAPGDTIGETSSDTRNDTADHGDDPVASQRQHLERQVADLTRHSTALEQTVAALTSSTSWSLTRPLRWMSAAVRRR